MTTCHQNGRSLRPSSRSRASRRPPTRRTRGGVASLRHRRVANGRTVVGTMAPVAAHRICRHSATKAAHLPSLSGSDKRRHMNRSEIPSFVCVSRRVSLPFNLGALNQSKDRLDRWGERCDAKSVSIARRVIGRNPALSRDSVGGICDHHGRTQRNECHIVRHP